MFQFLAWLVAICYQVIPDYGVAIALMTIIVMLVLTPLTWKSTRSMLEMQRLQPEIKKLQTKYKDDRQKLNEEMMAFYKEHKINPVGGCLPMLLQMPVFFIMYRVIRGLTHSVIVGALAAGGTAGGGMAGRTITAVKISGGTIENGKVDGGSISRVTVGDTTYKVKDGQIKNGVVSDLKVLDPKDPKKTIGEFSDLGVTAGDRGKVQGSPSYLSHNTKLYKDLRDSRGRLRSFGMDLGKSVSTQLHKVSFLTLLPYLFLLALVIVTQYIQTRQMSGRNAAAQQNPQAQMMQRVMPIMFGYFSFIVPAGLNVYFFTSALFRIGQQELMYRYDPVLVEHVKEQAKQMEAKAVEARSFVPKNLGKDGKAGGRNGKGGKPATGKNGIRPGANRPQGGRRKKGR